MVFTTRPTLRGYGGAVAAGHYLGATIGADVLLRGGNAADAACAMGFALQVLEPHMNGPAGEVPILYYDAGEDRVHVIAGQGGAPAAATIEHFEALGCDRIPGSGLAAATVPAAMDAWCQLLERFGSWRFAEVVAPAERLARDGFPMYPFLRIVLHYLEATFRERWPTSGALYHPIAADGARQRNPAYADVLASLARAEREAGGRREQGIRAARDAFYEGRVAEEIDRFARRTLPDADGREWTGLLTAADLAGYRARVEDPIAGDYRGARVWKPGPWTQGPVFLQQLALLAGVDLARLGPRSVDALHLQIESAKLAFADREACYGDPLYAEVPLATLLDDEYAARRRAEIDPERASFEIRPGLGRLPKGWPWIAKEPPVPSEPQAFAAAGRGDTTHCDAVDRHGNLVSATPSGAWIPSSPVIPALGFPLGQRGQMFVLDRDHPNALAPGKRPRTTLSPSLARLPDGRMMAFGTPGGDQQDQWTLQLFLELVEFGEPDLQAAIDAPTVHIHHVPDSFHPRVAQPGVVGAEDRLPRDVIEGLAARGHVVRASGDWVHGRVMAVTRHPETGLCEAAASPRSQVAYAAALP